WHYRNLPGLRGRIARAQHLSVASTFLGPKSMRVLGLPAYMPPWYPALRIPINLAHSVANAVVPGQRDRAAVRGREAQEAFVRLLTGADAATIGASAPVMDKSA